MMRKSDQTGLKPTPASNQHTNRDRTSYLQMSRAFLASPDTADTFLAQN